MRFILGIIKSVLLCLICYLNFISTYCGVMVGHQLVIELMKTDECVKEQNVYTHIYLYVCICIYMYTYIYVLLLYTLICVCLH